MCDPPPPPSQTILMASWKRNQQETWKQIQGSFFNIVVKNNPVKFHCVNSQNPWRIVPNTRCLVFPLNPIALLISFAVWYRAFLVLVDYVPNVYIENYNQSRASGPPIVIVYATSGVSKRMNLRIPYAIRWVLDIHCTVVSRWVLDINCMVVSFYHMSSTGVEITPDWNSWIVLVFLHEKIFHVERGVLPYLLET